MSTPPSTAKPSLTSPHDQPATFVELFFDLVFVFAITQVVSLVVHDLTWQGVFRGALVMALLWWGWGIWTWTCNAVDLEPRVIRTAVLASMLGVVIMAHAVPFSFEDDRGIWLAAGYLYVRLVGTIVFYVGVRHDPEQRSSFFSYAPFAMLAPIVVVIGAFTGDAQQWVWLAGFAVELLAAAKAGRADWKVDAGHFAERHGLIMIIALGEAIIAVGASVTDQEPSAELAFLLGLGLAGACAMWWAYFDRLQHAWETALRDADVHETGHIARDVYSLLHYPMITGVVFYAVALEEAFHHPTDPLAEPVRYLLAASLALYLLSMAVAVYRSWRDVLWERIAGVAVMAAVVLIWTDAAAKTMVLFTTVALIATMSLEYMRYRDRIRGTA